MAFSAQVATSTKPSTATGRSDSSPPHLHKQASCASCASTSSNLHSRRGDACDGVPPSTTSDFSASMILSSISFVGSAAQLSATGALASLVRQRTSSMGDSMQPRPPNTAGARRASVDYLSYPIHPLECPREEEEEEQEAAEEEGEAEGTSADDPDCRQCRGGVVHGQGKESSDRGLDVPAGIVIGAATDDDEEDDSAAKEALPPVAVAAAAATAAAVVAPGDRDSSGMRLSSSLAGVAGDVRGNSEGEQQQQEAHQTAALLAPGAPSLSARHTGTGLVGPQPLLAAERERRSTAGGCLGVAGAAAEPSGGVGASRRTRTAPGSSLPDGGRRAVGAEAAAGSNSPSWTPLGTAAAETAAAALPADDACSQLSVDSGGGGGGGSSALTPDQRASEPPAPPPVSLPCRRVGAGGESFASAEALRTRRQVAQYGSGALSALPEPEPEPWWQAYCGNEGRARGDSDRGLAWFGSRGRCVRGRCVATTEASGVGCGSSGTAAAAPPCLATAYDDDAALVSGMWDSIFGGATAAAAAADGAGGSWPGPEATDSFCDLARAAAAAVAMPSATRRRRRSQPRSKAQPQDHQHHHPHRLTLLTTTQHLTSLSPLVERTYSIRFAPSWTSTTTASANGLQVPPPRPAPALAANPLPQLPLPPLTGHFSRVSGACRDYGYTGDGRTAAAVPLGAPTTSHAPGGPDAAAASPDGEWRPAASSLAAAVAAAATAAPAEEEPRRWYRPCVTGYKGPEARSAAARATSARATGSSTTITTGCGGGSGGGGGTVFAPPSGVCKPSKRRNRGYGVLMATTSSLENRAKKNNPERPSDRGGYRGADGGLPYRRPYAATAGESTMYDVLRGCVGVRQDRRRGRTAGGDIGGLGAPRAAGGRTCRGFALGGEDDEDEDSIVIYKGLDLETSDLDYGIFGATWAGAGSGFGCGSRGGTGGGDGGGGGLRLVDSRPRWFRSRVDMASWSAALAAATEVAAVAAAETTDGRRPPLSLQPPQPRVVALSTAVALGRHRQAGGVGNAANYAGSRYTAATNDYGYGYAAAEYDIGSIWSTADDADIALRMGMGHAAAAAAAAAASDVAGAVPAAAAAANPLRDDTTQSSSALVISGRRWFDVPYGPYGLDMAVRVLAAMPEATHGSGPPASLPSSQPPTMPPTPTAAVQPAGSASAWRGLGAGVKRVFRGLSVCFVPRDA